MSSSADLWCPNGGDSVNPGAPRAPVNTDAHAVLDKAQADQLRREHRNWALDAEARESSEPSVPSNQCAICLGQMTRATKTVVEECFHSFCRECIATWCEKHISKTTQSDPAMGISSSAAGCPLCREPIVALLHDIRSDTEYLRSEPKDVREAAERVQAVRRRRVSAETNRALGGEQLDPFGPRALARRRAIYTSMQYSHRPYQRASLTLPATASQSLRLPVGGGASDLLRWLRRELTALLGVPDVEAIVHYVLGLCKDSGIPAPTNDAPPAGQALSSRGELHSSSCETALQQFMGDRTLHFLHELYAFALSPLPLEIYDRIRCYPDQRPSVSVVQLPSPSAQAAAEAGTPTERAGRVDQIRDQIRDQVVSQCSDNEAGMAESLRATRSRNRKDERRWERAKRRQKKRDDKARKRTRCRECEQPTANTTTAAEIATNIRNINEYQLLVDNDRSSEQEQELRTEVDRGTSGGSVGSGEPLTIDVVHEAQLRAACIKSMWQRTLGSQT